VGQACKAMRSSGDMCLKEDIDDIVSSGTSAGGAGHVSDTGIHVHMTGDQPGPRRVAGFEKPSGSA